MLLRLCIYNNKGKMSTRILSGVQTTPGFLSMYLLGPVFTSRWAFVSTREVWWNILLLLCYSSFMSTPLLLHNSFLLLPCSTLQPLRFFVFDLLTRVDCNSLIYVYSTFMVYVYSFSKKPKKKKSVGELRWTVLTSCSDLTGFDRHRYTSLTRSLRGKSENGTRGRR